MFWLSVGILAIIGLTGFNAYLLYQLQSNSIESIQQSKRIQIADLAARVRMRFYQPINGITKLDFKKIAQTQQQTGNFIEPFVQNVYEASKDSIFDAIYYVPAQNSPCYDNEDIFKFNENKKAFAVVDSVSSIICDGLGMAKTRMRVLIDGYQYNFKTLFDTHRSFTMVLIDSKAQKVVGYLVMPINFDYLINHLLKPELQKSFGGKGNEGITVWLVYWTKQEVLASSDPNEEYNFRKIDYVHQFPSSFDDLRLYAAMNESLLVASQSSSFVYNLILLGFAFVFLIGALVFMFITAKREKDLSSRQSQFLANVTHELKTPLAVIQAAGENLADGRIQNENRLKKYGSHIYSEALRLRHMIDKLLNAARADAGKSFVRPEPCEIDNLLIEFIDERRQYFESKGVDLDVSIEQNIPRVMLDEHSFYTILNNLVSNAIKYRQDDKFLGIYLNYDQKNIILRVQDHGVGMSEKVMKHIFEKFYRGEDSLTARTKGYGLGLSFVKNLVDLSKSTIKVESVKGKGSIFSVVFPAIIEPKEIKKPQIPQLQKV